MFELTIDGAKRFFFDRAAVEQPKAPIMFKNMIR